MKILIDNITPQQESVSASALKRTPVQLAIAVKRMPKLSAKIKEISAKIKVLKKKALQVYLVRHKADLAKAAKVKHRTKSTSNVVLSEGLQSMSASPKTVTTVASKKKGEKHLKSILKDPKTELLRKRMSAAMRIKENKPLSVKIKALIVKRDALHDKAWQAYVKKMNSSATGPTSNKNPTGKLKAAYEAKTNPKVVTKERITKLRGDIASLKLIAKAKKDNKKPNARTLEKIRDKQDLLKRLLDKSPTAKPKAKAAPVKKERVGNKPAKAEPSSTAKKDTGALKAKIAAAK